MRAIRGHISKEDLLGEIGERHLFRVLSAQERIAFEAGAIAAAEWAGHLVFGARQPVAESRLSPNEMNEDSAQWLTQFLVEGEQVWIDKVDGQEVYIAQATL